MANRNRRGQHRQVLSAAAEQNALDPRLKDNATAAAVQTALMEQYGIDIGAKGADGNFGTDSQRALKTLTLIERNELLAAAERQAHPEKFYKAVTSPADLQNGTYVMRIQQKLGDIATTRPSQPSLGQDGVNGDGVTGSYNAKTDEALMALPERERAHLLIDARIEADHIDGKTDAKVQAKTNEQFGQLPPIDPQKPRSVADMKAELSARAAQIEQEKKLAAQQAKPGKAKPQTARKAAKAPNEPASPGGGADTKTRGIAPDALSAQPKTIDNLDPKSTAFFDMKTGRIYLSNGQSFDAGSGKREAKNNFRAQMQINNTDKGVLGGPVPEGIWSVGNMAPNSYKMADKSIKTDDSMRLEAVGGTKTHGRGGFLIHPQHSQNYQTIGCVAVKDRAAVHKLNELKKQGLLKHLVVTRDYQQLKQQIAQKNGFGIFKSTSAAPSTGMPGMG